MPVHIFKTKIVTKCIQVKWHLKVYELCLRQKLDKNFSHSDFGQEYVCESVLKD